MFGNKAETGAVAAARACNAGTLLLLLQFGFAYYRRLPKPEREAFTAWYTGALQEHLDMMQAMIGQVLEE